MKEVCPSLCNACALNKEMEKRRREVIAQGGNPSKKRNSKLKYDSVKKAKYKSKFKFKYNFAKYLSKRQIQIALT